VEFPRRQPLRKQCNDVSVKKEFSNRQEGWSGRRYFRRRFGGLCVARHRRRPSTHLTSKRSLHLLFEEPNERSGWLLATDDTHLTRRNVIFSRTRDFVFPTLRFSYTSFFLHFVFPTLRFSYASRKRWGWSVAGSSRTCQILVNFHSVVTLQTQTMLCWR
jgi:hypothetical protein